MVLNGIYTGQHKTPGSERVEPKSLQPLSFNKASCSSRSLYANNRRSARRDRLTILLNVMEEHNGE